MSTRDPAILVVLIDTGKLHWHAGGIPDSGQAVPLLRSEDRNLDEYIGLEFDEQVSFLRHRLAGVLQRGCDRLYALQMKVSHFVLIADGGYPHAAQGLTKRLAEHFVEWMMNPPVSYVLMPPPLDPYQMDDMKVVAGDLPQSAAALLRAGLPSLVSAIEYPDRWECIPRPQRHQA